MGPDFKKVLYEEARHFWDFEYGQLLFSLEELARMDKDYEEHEPLPESEDLQINENRRRVANSLRLDVKNINVEIPQDVHFQNEEQTLEADTIKYARKATEIDRVFMAYISTKGHQFESKGRADKIASYLLEIIDDFFGIFDTSGADRRNRRA